MFCVAFAVRRGAFISLQAARETSELVDARPQVYTFLRGQLYWPLKCSHLLANSEVIYWPLKSAIGPILNPHLYPNSNHRLTLPTLQRRCLT